MFGLKFRDLLPAGGVLNEFENIVSTAREYLLVQHNDDGSHGAITASGNVVATGYGTFTGQHRAFVKAKATTLTSGAETVLQWETPAMDGAKDYTPDSGWNIGPLFDATAPTYLTAKVAGLYLINYSVRFVANATGRRYGFLSTLGAHSSPADLAFCIHGAHANGSSIQNTLILPMEAGQRVFLSVYQDSTGLLDIVTGFSTGSWIQMTKVG